LTVTEAAGSQTTTIGIGLVGAGWMGSLHAAAYRRVTEHYPDLAVRPRLVIVADPIEERARAVAQRYGFEQWTTNVEDVIEHPDVQAVSITAPNNMHLPVALALASRGTHFWGEKPLGRYPDETREIAAAVTSAGIRTLIGYNYRHVPAVVHARELIAAGELGEVRTYRGLFLVDYASHPQRAHSWRFSREVSGLGVLGDLMSHVVDMAQSLAGPIQQVTAEQSIEIPQRPRGGEGGADQFSLADGELADVENEDYVASLAHFASGAKATFEVSRVNVGHPVQMAFEVRGTRGAVSWDFERMGELQIYTSDDPLTGDRGFRRVLSNPQHGDFAHFQPDAGTAMSYNDLKVIEAKLFLQSLLDRRDAIPSVREALATAEVLDAMQRSFRTGAWERVGQIGAEAPAPQTGEGEGA
jgi:predicted dehydrogenase